MFRIEFVDNLTVKGIRRKSHRNTKTSVIYLDAELSGAERRQHLDYHHRQCQMALVKLRQVVPLIGKVA